MALRREVESLLAFAEESHSRGGTASHGAGVGAPTSIHRANN
jgi:hypothetical protein